MITHAKGGFLAGALLLAALRPGFAQDDSTAALIREAQAKARTNDVAAAREAYAKVFARPDLTIDQRIAAHMDIARVLQRAKTPDFGGAVKECEKALALPGIPDAGRFRLLNAIASAQFDSNFSGRMPSYHDDGIDAAAATYGKIAADPAAGNDVRIAALNGLANCLLEKMDVKGATTALERAAALPGLTPEEKVAARINLARGLHRQLEYGKARAICEEVLAEKPRPAVQADLEMRVADIIAATGKTGDAVNYLRSRNRGDLDIAGFCQKVDEAGAALEIYRAMVGDARLDDRLRWQAFERMLPILGRRVEFAEVRKAVEAHLPGFLEKDPKRNPFPRLLGWPFNQSGGMRDHEFVAWIARNQLARPGLPEKDVLTFNGHLFDALIGLGRVEEAAKVTEALLALPGLKPPARMQQRLVAAVLADPGKAAESAGAVLASFKPEEVSPRERAEALLQAARTALRLGRAAAANELDGLRQEMLAPEPRRSLPCEYAARAPRDISGFLASPLFGDPANRGKLDRPYGDNLQFLLETDSSTRGRKVDSGGAGAGPAEFCVTCDADGVSLFLLAPAAQAADAADGLAGMGGYEMYLAPGEGQAYYCFLVDLPEGKLSDGFVTMYNNRHFRQALLKEGTLRTETRVTPAGAATVVFLSWELFYDKLPGDGDAWQFDVIHWERGGMSWGGSRSVHNRSSFGDLVFSGMTRENLNAIKRRIAARAVARYRRERQGSANGLIDFWQDPELGDPEFYGSALRPLVEKLDGHARKVAREMSTEDVETVFSEAVPDWIDFRYRVAALRKGYLDRKRVAGK